MPTEIDILLEKSKESFILGIEIYNKPTLKYRLEGFSFFICNAWELMLKAHMINKFGENSIYYSDKPNRTLSLEACIQKVFTNKKAPLRLNLEKLVELRNTSTHFIVTEYEAIYVPLLQACVFNYADKLKEFHQQDITELIPENFITLTVSVKHLSDVEIRGKYSVQTADHLLKTASVIEEMIENNNSNFAIRIDHYHYQTKDPNKASEVFHIEKEAKQGVMIINRTIEPSTQYPFNLKKVNHILERKINQVKLKLLYKQKPTKLNRFHLNNIIKYFEIKRNKDFCFEYKVTRQPQYSYSQKAVDFIFEQIAKDPEDILTKVSNN